MMARDNDDQDQTDDTEESDKDKSVHKRKLKVKKEASTNELDPGKKSKYKSKNTFKQPEDSKGTKNSEHSEHSEHSGNTENSASKKKLKIKAKSKTHPKDANKAQLKIKDEQTKDKPVDERIINVDLKPDSDQKEIKKPEEISHRDESIYYLTGKGKSHPVHEMVREVRAILLGTGFNELENQYFVPEKDIFEQYSKQSGLVLDKTFYLGETQKVNIVVKPEILLKLKDIFGHLDFSEERFLTLVNHFNEHLNLREFFLELKEKLEFSNVDISRLIDEFPELKRANPTLTSITLRSKMDLPWMSTIKAILDHENFPLKVFSTGIWFKREPKLGEKRLRMHYGASCIIIDDKITLDKGKILFQEILERLGIGETKVEESKNKREYQIHNKEVQFYKDDIKLGTCGLFSKKLLENYDIETPVLYMNFGIEHLVMVKKHIDDIGELMYPQFHSAWKMNDSDIAKSIEFIQSPKTELGIEIARRMYKVCLNNNNAQSPCEFVIWDGLITPEVVLDESKTSSEQSPEAAGKVKRVDVERLLTVKVVRKDKGSKLCGPAMMNEIVVINGDIVGVHDPDQNPELTGAVRTKINYLNAFSKLVGSEIEKQVINNELIEGSTIKASIIKEMKDINLQLDGRAVRYISSNNKKIDVRGPLFVTVEFDIKDKEPLTKGAEKIKHDNKKHKKYKKECIRSLGDDVMREQFLDFIEDNLEPNQLLITCGLPGTYKTETSEEISRILGLKILRTDLIRLEVLKNEDIFDEKVASNMNKRKLVYDELFSRADELAKSGTGTILDATFVTQELRKRAAEVAARNNKKFAILQTSCPQEVSIDRILRRTKENYESNALTEQAYLNNKKKFQQVDIDIIKQEYPDLEILHFIVDTTEDHPEGWFVIDKALK